MARGECTHRRALRTVATVLVLAALGGPASVDASTSNVSNPSVTLRAEGAKFEFVCIPAGRFLMGSDTGGTDERPVHQVILPRDFHMMRTEVTVGQFGAFAEAAGYKTDAERGNWAWLCPAADLARPGAQLAHTRLRTKRG